MYVYTEGHSRIAGTGIYLPEERITSRDLMREIQSQERFGVSYEWLERVTGIREKRVTPQGILPSDMAVAAAREAMERAKITAREIDTIIYTGLTRDYLEPATAHLVQAKLVAPNATVFDISNACHGFMNGIHVMDALIATGQVRNGLVVTGEQGSLFARRAIEALGKATERAQLTPLAAGPTLGDAGAAVVMGPKKAPEYGLVGFMQLSRGQHAHYCTSGGPLKEGPLVTDMPGIIAQTIKLMVPIFQDFLYERLKWNIHDISKYIMHQTGHRTFRLHAKLGGIPTDIMPDTVTTLGNLITATFPVNLHLLHVNREVKEQDKIFLSGAGSGITVSQAGLVWDAAA